jgi:hypothetical protein
VLPDPESIMNEDEILSALENAPKCYNKIGRKKWYDSRYSIRNMKKLRALFYEFG